MTDQSSPDTPASIWETLLTHPLPLIGKWGQRIAFERLSNAARRGDEQAVHALVSGLSTPRASVLHPEIQDVFLSVLPSSSQDQLWQEWAAHRLPPLEAVLLEKNKQASYHAPAWAISLAKLEKTDSLQAVQPDRLAGLLALRWDADSVVVSAANTAITHLQRQESRDELFRLWAANRAGDLWQLATTSGYVPQDPVEVRVLFLLKIPAPDVLTHASAEMVPGLIQALDDHDPAIVTQARRCLPLLQKESAINAVCQQWQLTRSPLLADILRDGQMLATRPIELRLITALLTRRVQLACQTTAEGIPHLFKLTHDPDVHLAQSALDALTRLEKPAAQAALCMLGVNQDLPQALEIALRAGYRPTKPEQLALFLFLAGLWSEYDTMDFDNRLLQAAYETGQPELRQRIATQVQKSGKSAYLTILAGVDFRSNAAHLSAQEVRLLVEMLIENREWPRLWSLVHLVPLPWSIRILQTLPEASWRPENPAEGEEFDHLARLAQGLPLPVRKDWEKSLPQAIPAAQVRVSGRVNDVCFAPQKPLIAIGTGSRKLVEWDFQKAEIKRIRRGFSHSIARVAYVGSEYLVCGVRSNVDAACWIYGWQDEDAFVLPGHQGAVTALLPVGETNLVSAGRDGMVIHWNLAHRAEVARQGLPDWPRAAFISPNQQKIVLLHSSLSILKIPNLVNSDPQSVRTAVNSGTRPSKALCGVFPPNSDDFLVGQRNGQIVRYLSKPENRGLVREVVGNGKFGIVDLALLPSLPVLVAARMDGDIEFRRWPDCGLLGKIETGTGRLTSLHISADGAFMACGTDESTMQLWDLRIRDLPDLIDRPLSTSQPTQLAAVTGLLRNPAVPGSLKQTLQLAEALLQRRFRFDIQVDDLYQIQPGEFDIILD